MESLGLYAFLSTFKKPIVIIGLIAIILFIAGYYKFAVPVNKEYEERMTHFDTEAIFINSEETGEKICYKDINPMRTEIARALDDKGHILPGKKERVAELSEELIVKILGETYRIEEVNKDGETYYNYYIGTIRMEDKQYCASVIEQRIISKYKKEYSGYSY